MIGASLCAPVSFGSRGMPHPGVPITGDPGNLPDAEVNAGIGDTGDRKAQSNRPFRPARIESPSSEWRRLSASICRGPKVQIGLPASRNSSEGLVLSVAEPFWGSRRGGTPQPEHTQFERPARECTSPDIMLTVSRFHLRPTITFANRRPSDLAASSAESTLFRSGSAPGSSQFSQTTTALSKLDGSAKTTPRR